MNFPAFLRSHAAAALPAALLLAALGTSAFFINDPTLVYLFASFSLAAVALGAGIASGAFGAPQVPRTLVALPVLSFALYLWSVCRSPAVNASLLEAYALMAVPAAMLVGLCASQALWRLLVPGLLMLGAAFASAGLADRLIFGNLTHGPFADTNSFAAVTNVVMLLALATMADRSERGWVRSVAGVALALSFAAAITAVSRGGWLSLVLVCIVGAVVLRPAATTRKQFAVAIAVIVAAGLLSVGPRLMEAHRTGSDRSATSRVAQLASAQMVMKDYPDGVGLGLWTRVYPRYRLEADDDSAGFHLHNDYLEILVETGSAGLLAMVLPGLLAAFLLWRLARRGPAPGASKVVALGYLLAFAVIAVHAVVNFIFHGLVLSLAGGLLLGRGAHLVMATGPVRRAGLRGAALALLGAAAVIGWMGLSYISHVSLDAVNNPYGTAARRFPGLSNVDMLDKLEAIHPFEARLPLSKGLLQVAQATQPSALTREQRVELFHAAFANLEEARRRDPVDAGILYQMALARYYFRQPIEGNHLLAKSLALHPTRSASVQLYVQLRLVEHDFDAARTVLNNAMARSPKPRKEAFMPLQKVIDDAEKAYRLKQK